MSAAGAAEGATAVPDVVAPPPHHPRFPLSDGVRGVATVVIVFIHAWIFANGFLVIEDTLANRMIVRLDGLVATFFLLSAFLLYRPMIAHRAGGPARPSVGTYGKGRFLRIYPVYWVILTMLAIAPGLVGVFTDKWWSFYSLAFYLDPLYGTADCPAYQDVRCGLPQTWTLTAEVTFYAILPLYFGLTSVLARGRDVRRWMRAELILLAALSGLLLFLSVPPVDLGDEAWFRYSFLGHFFWLALGLGLAVLSVAYRGPLPVPSLIRGVADRPSLPWLFALAVYAATVAALPPIPFPVAPFSTGEYLGSRLAHGVFAALILLPVVFGNPNRGVPARILTNRTIVWFGLISYSLYLWHVTIAADLGVDGAGAGFVTVAVGTFVVAVPLAAATYYLVERPVLRLKYKRLRDANRRRRRTLGSPPDATARSG